MQYGKVHIHRTPCSSMGVSLTLEDQSTCFEIQFLHFILMSSSHLAPVSRKYAITDLVRVITFPETCNHLPVLQLRPSPKGLGILRVIR